MAKKPSGLGRGLGDLLEDNMPQVSKTHQVILKKEEPVTVSPQEEEEIRVKKVPEPPISKPLFDQPIRNKSIKANFVNKK